jgi:lipoate---protein ligase
LNIQAEFSGRNDITIDGKKFSGNAQYYYRNRLLHHGTILFNSDLSVVQDALNVKQEKIESKGVKSVKNRVTNVYPYLQNKITIDEFKDTLLKFFMNNEKYKEKEYIILEDELNKIDELMKTRFSKWEWNYGESPAFDIEKGKRFAGGKLELKFNVIDGIIKKFKITGDFFGKKEVTELETLLEGKKYRELDIKNLLENTDFQNYFAGITIDDFMDCMFY